MNCFNHIAPEALTMAVVLAKLVHPPRYSIRFWCLTVCEYRFRGSLFTFTSNSITDCLLELKQLHPPNVRNTPTSYFISANNSIIILQAIESKIRTLFFFCHAIQKRCSLPGIGGCYSDCISSLRKVDRHNYGHCLCSLLNVDEPLGNWWSVDFFMARLCFYQPEKQNVAGLRLKCVR